MSLPKAKLFLTLSASIGLWACNSDRRGVDPADRPPAGAADFSMSGGNGIPDGGFGACKKVDILFVVDNSASMADNQKSLIASFPGFIAGMQKQLVNAEDYHIGVVTSDSYYAGAMGCTDIGSLVTKTGGVESSKKDCGPFLNGDRFLTNKEPNLSDKFACIAQVGVGGNDDEQMARGLLNALSPTKAKPGACNAGFLRPNSLLVIVMITDEDDVPDGCEGDKCMTYGSGGTPDAWYDEFLRYRTDPKSVVVLSILGRRGDNPCGATAASRLMRFTNKFGQNGSLGDICATNYDSFFRDALPVLSTACANIPG